MTLKTLSILAFLFIFSFGFGQTLVVDINRNSLGSEPENLTAFEENLYFTALNNENENLLYRMHPNTKETILLKNFSSKGQDKEIGGIHILDNQLYVFVSNYTARQLEIWALQTDGSFEKIVIDGSFNVYSPIEKTSDEFYFFISNFDETTDERVDLWRSNGTQDGTLLVDRFCMHHLTGTTIVFENEFYFFMRECSTTSVDLWKSDGTPENTKTLKALDAASASHANGSDFIVYKNRLYFIVQDKDFKRRIWVSDGTTEGTQIFAGASDLAITTVGNSNLAISNNHLFFGAKDEETGTHLWKTDGTIENTEIVETITTNSIYSPHVFNLYHSNGLLFFNVSGTSQIGLWRSDGTATGTYKLNNLRYRGNVRATYNGMYYFIAVDQDFEYGIELWKSDGTSAGTQMVIDIFEGSKDSDPAYLTTLNDVLYFSANNNINGREIWQTAGTSTTTQQALDLNSDRTRGANPEPWFTFKDELYFVAQAHNLGMELWKTNTHAVIMLRDIAPGEHEAFDYNLYQNRFLLMDDYFLFYTFQKAHREDGELWISDGSGAGTKLLKDINPGDRGSFIKSFTRHQNTAYFHAYNGTHTSLWKTSGTEESTIELVESSGGEQTIASLGEGLIFSGRNKQNGRELWITDGTLENSRLLTDIENGKEDSNPKKFTVIDNDLYFSARTRATGRELWKTDGTEEGTVLVKDIHPKRSSNPDYLTAFKGKLLFSAKNDINGEELWISDGTTEGTKMLKDINAGKAGSRPNILLSTDKYLYFTAYTRTTGKELWRTDGTSEGTILLSDFFENDADDTSDRFVVTALNNDLILFSVLLSKEGRKQSREYWISDGSKEGTKLLIAEPTDLFSQKSLNAVLFDDKVFFKGKFNEKGYELYYLLTDICEKNNIDIKDLVKGGIYQATEQITLSDKTADRSSVVVKAGYEIVFEEGFETAEDG